MQRLLHWDGNMQLVALAGPRQHVIAAPPKHPRSQTGRVGSQVVVEPVEDGIHHGAVTAGGTHWKQVR